MGRVLIEPATVMHGQQLVPMLRAEDAAEVMASGGYTPEAAVAMSLRLSTEAWAVWGGGELLALFGVVAATALGEKGCVWALTSTAVERHRREFWAASRYALPQLLHRWGMLFNRVDARYVRAVAWLKRLGAEVGEPSPWGKAGLPFHPFYFRRPPAPLIERVSTLPLHIRPARNRA